MTCLCYVCVHCLCCADLASLKDALAVVGSLAVTINESVRSSEKTQSLLEEGKHKEVLSEYARGDRTVTTASRPRMVLSLT